MLVGWVESTLVWLLVANKGGKLVVVVMVISLAGTHGLCGNTVVELPCNGLIEFLRLLVVGSTST